MKFVLKYYAKIEAAEKAEAAQQAETGHPAPLPPFDVNDLGVDSTIKRTLRQLFTWAMLCFFWVLRGTFPNLRIGRLVFVTRYQDVRDVLNRSQDFEVPFRREMATLTNGPAFFLGLDGDEHKAQIDHVLACFNQDDHGGDVLKDARELTTNLLKHSGGRIDVVRDLVTRVVTETCRGYFGLDIDEPNGFAERLMAMSNMLFADPFGDPAARVLGRSAAVQVRTVIDRSIKGAIERAKAGQVEATLTSRLAARHVNNPDDASLTPDIIRAILMGMVTGFIPTTTLGASKMIEELLRQKPFWNRAIEHARNVEKARPEDRLKSADRTALKEILIECGRLNPALFGGVWRCATQDCTVGSPTGRPRPVRKGDVLLVASQSALRDSRVFSDPSTFKTGRFRDREKHPWTKDSAKEPPVPVTLMFGDGSHYCIGERLAMELITEIFQVVLSRDKIRETDNPVGWLSYIGGFPRRLDLKFTPEVSPSEQNMVLIGVPAKAGMTPEQAKAAIAEIERLGNPARGDRGFGKALDETEIVHFASFSLVNGGNEDKPDWKFLLEINLDGDGDAGIARVAAKVGDDYLDPIFKAYADRDERESLTAFLQRQRIELHRYPWGAIGLGYMGTLEFSVYDIERQSRLAQLAAEALEEFDGTPPKIDNPIGSKPVRLPVRPLKALEAVREKVLAKDRDMASFLVRPSRRRLLISEWVERDTSQGAMAFLASPPVVFVGYLLVALGLAMSTTAYYVMAPRHWLSETAWIASLVLLGGVLLRGTFLEPNDKFSHAVERIARRLPDIIVGMLGLGILVLSALFLYLTMPDRLHPWWQAVDAFVGLIVVPLVTIAALIGLGYWCTRLDEIDIPDWVPRAVVGIVVVALVALAIWQVGIFGHLLGAVVVGIGMTVVVVLLVLGVITLMLRFHEMSVVEAPEDKQPPLDYVQKLAEREDKPGYLQNHLTSVTQLKPGWFRKATLASALWIIGKLVLHWFRPGFILDMGTIHYAQWFRLPGTEKLVFITNYDGSWESYLEDFITKAPKGQTMAWGHGIGFPRLEYFMFGGARDGDRFKRWVRRQQVPTHCWYSRFPQLTTDQIRTNAMIHDGLMRARTDTAARAWLDCFGGTVPRPDYAIEDDEVQSLVFRGFSELPYVSYALIPLPDNAPETYSEWLNQVNGRLTLGDRGLVPKAEHHGCATFIAFSRTGLKKIGDAASGDIKAKESDQIDGATLLAKFPVAFNTGMAQRPRAMGDVGDAAPNYWKWTDVEPAKQPDGRTEERPNGSPTVTDVLLIIYGPSETACEKEIDQHRQWIGGDTSSWRILSGAPSDDPRDRAQPWVSREPFGFRDGISQPVMRGTRRYGKKPLERDAVEPGEFILGYHNNQKYYPPRLTVAAQLDPGNILPIDIPDFAGRFPRFRIPGRSDQRDFGRNGTFIAVREFLQHVDEFHAFTEDQATALKKKYPDLPAAVGDEIDGKWIEAKMMGRWHDGVSLIARPSQDERLLNGKPRGTDPDNDFDYGVVDPQGLQCPFGAHIRRANPRDSLAPGSDDQIEISNRHRILRRGRSFTGDNEKGLLFVAVCGDLERQFEFVQQTWISSPSFHGLRNEPDPLLAARAPKAENGETLGPECVFSIPTSSKNLQIHGIRSFVDVRGGGYFFMPSRSALQFLCARNRAAVDARKKASDSVTKAAE